MRVFAGPNGSGKSTMYNKVASTNVSVKGRIKPVDIGIYLNPDDIAEQLKTGQTFDFSPFKIRSAKTGIVQFAKTCGLLRKGFSISHFRREHYFNASVLVLRRKLYADQFAQLITAYLCNELINLRQKFSFETVFSHESKLDLMKKARAAGYKVYLYFIATEDPAINKDRVRTRALHGGHDVPPELIVKRYHRSLGQLKDAIKLSYHSFLFDNTTTARVFAEYREATNSWSRWDHPFTRHPNWFKRHYIDRLSEDQFVERLMFL